MIDLAKLSTNKEAQNLLTIITVISGVFIIFHYSTAIKLNRLKIKEMEQGHSVDVDAGA